MTRRLAVLVAVLALTAGCVSTPDEEARHVLRTCNGERYLRNRAGTPLCFPRWADALIVDYIAARPA